MTYQLSDSFKFASLEGGGVLLDLVKGEYWQLNSLGALLLRRISGGENTEIIIRDIKSKYPEAAPVISTDVEKLLRYFSEIGAISDE